MPQLNSASFISQAFWLIVCFCTLWTLLAVFITPKITDIVEQRKRKINGYIQKADELNTQAKISLTRYNDVINQAQEKAKQELEDGKKNLDSYLNNEQQRLSEELRKEIAARQTELSKEKKQTIRLIESISCDAALEIVHKFGFSQISRQDIADVARKEKDNG